MLRRTRLSRKVIRAPGTIKLRFCRGLIKPFKNTFQCIFQVRSGKFSPATDFTDENQVETNRLKNFGPVKITASDNGLSALHQFRDKIFQLSNTIKPSRLGLCPSFEIVKVHGGEISAESYNGMGSSFMIKLKLND